MKVPPIALFTALPFLTASAAMVLAVLVVVGGCTASATSTPAPVIEGVAEGQKDLPPTPTPLPETVHTPTAIAAAKPAPDAGAALDETPTPPPNPPGIRLTYSLDTVYYPVTGTTTQEIFDSVKANGPDSELELQGRFTSGLTESDSSYRSEFVDHGDYCELQSAVANLDLVVTLPQHSAPSSLSDLQLGRWQDFADGVAVHEQHHVDIYIERIEAFKESLESFPERFSDCDSLESTIASAWELEKVLTDREQEAFHESEEQLSQRVREPVQQQIDENELKLAEYQDALTQLSLEIEELNSQIDDFEESMQPYDARISAIKDLYPDLVLPQDTFDEYRQLIVEWNRINDLRNGAVTQLNSLVDQHDRAVDELNRLTEQTIQLIDQLNWLP